MAKQAKTDKQKLAELLGLEAPTTEDTIQEAREEEAVAAYLENKRLFSKVACKQCGKMFAVNRANVAFCSRHCLRKHLKERYGLTKVSDPNGPNDERWVWQAWWGNEPLVVPPQALSVLQSHELAGQAPEEGSGSDTAYDNLISTLSVSERVEKVIGEVQEPLNETGINQPIDNHTGSNFTSFSTGDASLDDLLNF